MFDESVTNVNSIKASSTSGLVSKTQYDSGEQILEKRLKILIKRYLILVDWSKKLFKKHRSQRLKTKTRHY